MGFYPDVQPGQKYSPSAALENEIRHHFNALNGFTVPAGSAKSEYQLKVYNSTDHTLCAGTITAPAKTGVIIEGAIPVCRYDAGDRFFGIVPQDIAPGEFGSCIISGPVEVPVSGFGTMVSPAVDGQSFTACHNGGTTPLLYSSEGRGIILLGANSGSGFNYTGYFKIVNIEGARFEIINGYKEDDTICGRTDVPGFEEIPRFSFELAYNAATVALCLYRIGENYDMQFTIGKWNDGFAQMMIGNVYADGKVEQSYMGGTIFFGREWFL